MKIYVVPRFWIEKQINKNPDWILGKWIISIFSKNSYSPIDVDRFNILKLEFDDVTEKDQIDDVIHFNKDHAKQIVNFIKPINDDGRRIFYVHCDAGVSRSGAVGYMLNEWFNKYIELKRVDNESFTMNNNHIMPNPEVVRILKDIMFGSDYNGIWVNDYEYNEDGERIDHISQV